MFRTGVAQFGPAAPLGGESLHEVQVQPPANSFVVLLFIFTKVNLFI